MILTRKPPAPPRSRRRLRSGRSIRKSLRPWIGSASAPSPNPRRIGIPRPAPWPMIWTLAPGTRGGGSGCHERPPRSSLSWPRSCWLHRLRETSCPGRDIPPARADQAGPAASDAQPVREIQKAHAAVGPAVPRKPVQLIGNTRRGLYHLSTCVDVQSMSEHNRINLKDAAEAVSRACGPAALPSRGERGCSHRQRPEMTDCLSLPPAGCVESIEK